MPKKLARGVVVLVAVVCACFLAAAPAGADPGPEAEVSLEEAIGIAKGIFPVPAEFAQFNSDYARSGEQGAVWNLRWSNENPPGGSQNVTVSAEDGAVLGFSFYRGVTPGTTYRGLPPYSREQALEMARDWAQKLQPERFAQTRLAPEPADYIPLTEIGSRNCPVTHSFRFERLHDGIPVAGEGIMVQINGDSGELLIFSLDWQRDLALPAAAGRISAEKARQIFNADGLELIYVYTGSRERDTGERPYPVYAVRDGRFVVDALTGKPIGPDDDLFSTMDGGMGGAPRDEAAKELSPQEAARVEETKGLLSAEAARRAAAAAYRLPGDAVPGHTSLRPNWDVPGGKVWEFGYTSEKAKAEMNLQVDAKTGALLGLRIYEQREPQDYYKAPTVNFSEDGAREKALAFMRALEPQKAREVTLRGTRKEIGPWAEKGAPLPQAYNFTYARVANNISYPDNGFTVTVNSTTGEVTGYALNWWEVAMPPLQGVLDKGGVGADYLKGNPLTLEYARVYPRYGGERKPRYQLIYRLQDRADRMVDARSGQLLDNSGKPVTERAKGFSDIAGHPSEPEIMLLLRAGIIAGDKDQFRPDSPITNAELIAMLVNAYGDRHYYPPAPVKEGAPWYAPSLERAVAMGIIDRKDQYDPAASTSRLQAARMLVNAAGYGPLAKLGALFRLEAADAARVPAGDRGYAAAAAGLDLVPLQNGRFEPDAGLTRGEIAWTLVQMLSK